MKKTYLCGLIISVFSLQSVAQSTTITPESGIVGQYTNQKITVQTDAYQYGFEHTDGNVSLTTYIGGNNAWLLTKSNHPLFFTANNNIQETTPSLSILPNGNVGIGTSSPSEKLHVLGNARISGLGGNGVKFIRVNNIGVLSSTPQTSYLNISRAAFLSVNGNTIGSNNNGGIYCAGNTVAALESPINLPDGAVITNIAAYYTDNSSKNVKVQLHRRTYTANTSTIIATFSSTGASGSTDILSEDVDINAYNIVDNNMYVYYIRVSAVAIVNNNDIPTTWGDGTNLTINQIKVTYSY